MRNLLPVIMLTMLIACNKDKDVNKLPRALRDVVRHMDCDLNPLLEKFTVGNYIYYKMTWIEPGSVRKQTLYNEQGNPIIPAIEINPTGPPETVWRCK